MRTRRLRLTALLATAIAVGGIGPAGAGAASKEFYGVISIHPLTQADFTTMGRGRVGTLRTLLNWSTVEPMRGARNWTAYDELVEDAALNGVRVMPTIYGSPGFAAPRAEAPPGPAARADFAGFLAEAVARYGNGGSFWSQFALEHPGVPPLPFKDWQVWNEVNSPSFWGGWPAPKRYGTLLKLVSRTIRGVDPAARIVLAGLFPIPSGHPGGMSLARYLNRLYRVKKVEKFFDAVAVHPYGGDPKEVLSVVRQLRALLQRNGDGETSAWITEMGWASSGDGEPLYTADSATQAAYLRKTFQTLTKLRQKLRLAGVIWYSLRDNLAGSDWLYRSGLLEESGLAKPAWAEFVRFTGGSP